MSERDARFSRYYDVERVTYPSFDIAGALAGVPVIEVVMGSKGKKLTQHDIAQKIDRIDASALNSSPARWVAITGETRRADIDLMLAIRVLQTKRVYIEVDGTHSLCNADGRMAMWDHVCLRPRKLPITEIKCELFHSVMVDATIGPALSLSRRLDAMAYNGDRFALSSDAGVELVMHDPRSWRLTAPTKPAQPFRGGKMKR